MQDRVSDLEAALSQLEVMSQSRFQEVSEITMKEIKNIENEKKTLQSSLFTAQAEMSTFKELKTQVC